MHRMGETTAFKDRNLFLKGADIATQRGWTGVPNFILESKEISVGAKLIYAMLKYKDKTALGGGKFGRKKTIRKERYVATGCCCIGSAFSSILLNLSSFNYPGLEGIYLPNLRAYRCQSPVQIFLLSVPPLLRKLQDSNPLK